MPRLLLRAVLIPAAILGAATGSPDTAFYKSLAQEGLAEVELGRLAADRGADPSVRNFGAMMVKDHSAANAALKSLAASKDLSLPDGPDVAAHAKKVQLEALSGATFDKSYVKNQIEAHQRTLSLLEKEVDSGKDPDAQAFALKALPTVQSHLIAIEKIAATLGIAAIAPAGPSSDMPVVESAAVLGPLRT
jgi:putative membrane protein